MYSQDGDCFYKDEEFVWQYPSRVPDFDLDKAIHARKMFQLIFHVKDNEFEGGAI